MSAEMRSFMEAYSAVHNTEVKENLDKGRDSISEMNLSQLTDVDLCEIAEEVLEVMFAEGKTVAECEAIVESILPSSSNPGRQAKIDRLKETFERVFGRVKEKSVKTAVESYAMYRKGKSLQDNWSRKFSHENGNVRLHNSLVAEDRAGVKNGLLELYKGKHGQNVDEATAMAKRGYDEAPIRQKIAKSTGGGKAADRATALEKKPTFGDAKKEKQRQDLARKQRGDFRKTTSSSPGLHGYGHKSNDPAVKAKQAARGAQRGVLTPNEKKELNREEFVSEKKGDGNLANNYPPYDKVTRGDVIAGATGKDQMGGKNIRGNDSKAQKARLEKKRGMKLDDHPQFKEELEATGKFTAKEIEAIIDKL